MKIYTKTGDAGDTGLFGGGRVPKDHPRVAAYGEVDSLNAAVGFAASLEPATWEGALLEGIQRDLFTTGAILATPDPRKPKTPPAPITAERITALEQAIDRLEHGLPPLDRFILPGGGPKGAAFHVARTTCRRAERAVVTLARSETIPKEVLIYLNRLSDLLFVLARSANQAAGHPELQW
ncbi:MAG TPA: cob(I)yrinic acid a,c-diamide adenosyltransferase [Gemmatimonadales bacterium]